MQMKSGEIYYYYVQYTDDNSVTCVKVRVERAYEDSPTGIRNALKIIKVIIPGYSGNESTQTEGAVVSANEFQGVGSIGIAPYFFTEHKLIKWIFH